MTKMRTASAVVAALLSLSLAACSSGSGKAADPASTPAAAVGGKLVVYTNSNADGRAEWLTAQAKKAGFDIQVVGQGGGDTTNKLIAEKNNPVADVVFGLNNMYFEQLEAAKVLTDYTPSWSGHVDPKLGDDDEGKTYWPVVKQGILLTYNSGAYKTPADAPQDWLDLWNNPKFKGRYQTETGLGGATTQLVFAGILTRYKDPNGELGVSDEGWKQIKGYFDNGNPAEKGVDLFARMQKGTVDMGQMWSSGLPKFQKTYGIQAGVVRPAVGVPFAVEQVSLVKGSKNEDQAKKFIDWFGSAEVQGAWTKEFNSMPANSEAVKATDPAIVEFHNGLTPQQIDWKFATENMSKWIEKIELEYMK
ncbi:extracellular solute-binding protein [Propionibacteriaceae bacterium G57]|uniref:extracellular solute-binding protein n=1 Tax=Aestuariimicrobium sp. G57 TaxID=3418485 RepID=UPI003DA7649B